MMIETPEQTIVAAFYHFFDFPDRAERRDAILAELLRLEIKGSLLLASEGINGTLSGSRGAIDACLAYLKSEVVRGEFEHKESRFDRQPFRRTRVRLKKELIALGEPVSPRRATGRYVSPSEWNALIADPETIVLDARNSYEVHLGTFDRAIDPKTRTFRELPAFVREHLDPARHRKVATFCTGGIRCEKFSAWLIEQGFEDVSQLQGGILKYLEVVPAEASTWRGECYVFDERVAVGPGLAPSATATLCRACGHALKPEDRATPEYVDGERCGFCATGPHRSNVAAD